MVKNEWAVGSERAEGIGLPGTAELGRRRESLACRAKSFKGPEHCGFLSSTLTAGWVVGFRFRLLGIFTALEKLVRQTCRFKGGVALIITGEPSAVN